MYETRGVHAAADNIVIGNGVTPLLRILGYILRNKHSRIAVEEPGFRMGREVFRSGGYEIVPLPLRDDGLDVDALAQADTGLVYVTPSHQFPTGKIMPVGQRYKLLDWAALLLKMITTANFAMKAGRFRHCRDWTGRIA